MVHDALPWTLPLICSLQLHFIHRGGPLRYFNTNRCITFQWPDPQHIEGATLECMHRHTMTLLTRRVLVCPPRKEDLIFYSDFRPIPRMLNLQTLPLSADFAPVCRPLHISADLCTLSANVRSLSADLCPLSAAIKIANKSDGSIGVGLYATLTTRDASHSSGATLNELRERRWNVCIDIP